MADEKKTYLINIESNLKKYADEAAEAKKKVDDLAASNKALKESGTASATEIEVNNAALRNAQKEYSQAKKMVDLSTAANNSNKNSRKQLGEILNLEMLALGKLGNGMIKNKDGVLVLNKAYVEQQQKIANTKKAIIDYDKSLNDGRSNIGRYGEAVKGAIGQAASSIFAFAAPVAVATAALNGLIEAFKGTEAGAKLMGKAKIQMDTFFGAIVTGKFGYAFGNKLPKDMKVVGDMLDEIRVNDRKDLTEIAKRELEIKNLRLDSVKAGKGSAEQAALLVKALEKENELIEYKVKDKEEELRLTNLILDKAPTNTAALNKQAELEAEILNIKGEKSLRMATKLQTIEEKRIADAAKTNEEKKKWEKDYEDWYFKQLDAQAEKEKRLVKDQIALKLLQAKGDPEKMKAALKFQYEEDLKLMKDNQTQKKILEITYNEAIALIDKEAKDKKDALVKTDMEAGFELQRLKAKEDTDLLQGVLDAEYEAAIMSIEYKRMSNNERLLLDQIYMDASAALAKQKLDQMRTDADNEKLVIADALGAISDVIGKQTAIGKTLAIAQATINTWVAASQALRDPTLPSVIMKIAAMVAIIGSGLMTVANIVKVKVPGGGGGSTPSMPTAISSSVPAQRTFAQSAGSTIFSQPQLSQTQLNALPQQGMLTAADIAAALSKMPSPIVTVEDINAKVNEVQKIKVNATI